MKIKHRTKSKDVLGIFKELQQKGYSEFKTSSQSSRALRTIERKAPHLIRVYYDTQKKKGICVGKKPKINKSYLEWDF